MIEGYPMEPFRIGVDEFDRGRPCCCRTCPAALSINKRLLLRYFAEVFNTGIVIRKREGGYGQVAACSTPPELKAFINLIDTWDDVDWGPLRDELPVEFDLPALSPGLFV